MHLNREWICLWIHLKRNSISKFDSLLSLMKNWTAVTCGAEATISCDNDIAVKYAYWK